MTPSHIWQVKLRRSRAKVTQYLNKNNVRQTFNLKFLQYCCFFENQPLRGQMQTKLTTGFLILNTVIVDQLSSFLDVFTLCVTFRACCSVSLILVKSPLH